MASCVACGNRARTVESFAGGRAFGVCARRECRSQAARLAVLEAAGVPPGPGRAYHHATLADFRADRTPPGCSSLPSEVVAELTKGPRNVLLAGPCGSGKTHAAAALLGRWTLQKIEKGREARAAWIHVPNLRARFGSVRSRTEREAFRSVVTADLLVLDELVPDRTGYLLSECTRIVDARLSHDRATVATTNLAPHTVQALDPRLGSRLKAYRLVELVGEDRRALAAT